MKNRKNVALIIVMVCVMMFSSVCYGLDNTGGDISCDAYPESEHHSGNVLDKWYKFEFYDDNVKSLTIKFSDYSNLDWHSNYVYICDSQKNIRKSYTGDEITGAELSLNGNKFWIHIVSDYEVNNYGFSIDSITPSYEPIEIAPTEAIYVNYDNNGYYYGDVGDTIKLTCEIYPSNATSDITWSSSAPDVATVENGTVTVGETFGSVEITATASDGVTGSVWLDIQRAIFLSADSLQLKPGDTFKLDVINGMSSEPYIYWDSHDPSIVSVDNDGTVCANSPGTVWISAGEAGECRVTVSDSLDSGKPVIQSTLTMFENEEYILPLTGNADMEYYGYSYDDEIAEYDGYTRTITAHKSGDVSLSFDDGSQLNVRVIKQKCEFTVADGIITAYEGNGSTVVIPAEYKGEQIIGIGSRVFYGRTIKHVIIEEGVTEIRGNAFYGATIEKITIPASMRHIYAYCKIENCDVVYNGTLRDQMFLNIEKYDNAYICEKLGTIEIYSEDELFLLADAVNTHGVTQEGKTFILMNDIDLGGKEWTPIGISYSNQLRFNGDFDGNNYTISNFKITKIYESTGFFGCTGGGSITDLNIADADIKVNLAEGDTWLWGGTFVGFSYCTDMENCSASGKVSVVTNNQNENCVGGFAGRIGNGTIKNCTSSVDLDVHTDTYITSVFLGGFTGYTYGVIDSCKSQAKIMYNGKSNYTEIGGMVGFQAHDIGTEIKGCEAKGAIEAIYSGTQDKDEYHCYLGGIVGFNERDVTNNTSYVDITYEGNVKMNVDTVIAGTSTLEATNTNNTSYGTVTEVAVIDSSECVKSGDNICTYNISVASGTVPVGTLIVAVYTEEGELVGVSYESIDGVTSNRADKTGEVYVSQSPYLYKVFLWDSIDNLSPKARSVDGLCQ